MFCINIRISACTSVHKIGISSILNPGDDDRKAGPKKKVLFPLVFIFHDGGMLSMVPVYIPVYTDILYAFQLESPISHFTREMLDVLCGEDEDARTL